MYTYTITNALLAQSKVLPTGLKPSALSPKSQKLEYNLKEFLITLKRFGYLRLILTKNMFGWGMAGIKLPFFNKLSMNRSNRCQHDSLFHSNLMNVAFYAINGFEAWVRYSEYSKGAGSTHYARAIAIYA